MFFKIYNLNSADYYDEISSEHFVEWLTDIPSPALTVHASSNNKQKAKPPTTSDKKEWHSDLWSTLTNVHQL